MSCWINNQKDEKTPVNSYLRFLRWFFENCCMYIDLVMSGINYISPSAGVRCTTGSSWLLFRCGGYHTSPKNGSEGMSNGKEITPLQLVIQGDLFIPYSLRWMSRLNRLDFGSRGITSPRKISESPGNSVRTLRVSMVNFAFTTLMISSHPPDDCLLVSARVRQRKTRTARHGMGVRTLPECESHGS